MLLNYDFLEFENDKKVRVIDDKLCVNILDFFGILLGLSQRLDLLKKPFTKDFTDEEQKKLIKAAKSDCLNKDFLRDNDGIYRKLCSCKTFNKTFVDKFTINNSKVTMKDFMSTSTQGFITRYKYSYSDYVQETQRLKSFLDGKRDFLGYIQAIGYWKEKVENDLLPNKEISFFVFQNEPSKTFNLRNYLLLLARLFDQEAMSALSSDFDEVWAEFSDITFSVPSQLP